MFLGSVMKSTMTPSIRILTDVCFSKGSICISDTFELYALITSELRRFMIGVSSSASSTFTSMISSSARVDLEALSAAFLAETSE